MDPNLAAMFGGQPGGDMGSMLAGFWDSPLVAQIAFPARPASKGDGLQAGMDDGEIAVDGGSVAYRVYSGLPADKRRAVCVYFHGNAEICTDVGYGISDFYDAGVGILSVDYRGYAWSKGQPKMSSLCPDAEAVHAQVPTILAKAGLEGLPVLLFGRSLGATCAVHLATTFPEAYAGVVLESGLQTIKDLPMLAPLSQMIPGADAMLPMLPEPLGTLEKMGKLSLPVLFIHALADEIVPFAQAEKAFARAPSADKAFEKVAGGAGHNDLLARAHGQYFAAFTGFLDRVAGGGMTAEDVEGLSVKELKAALNQRSIDHAHCVEKSELKALLLKALPAAAPADAAPAPAPAPAPADAKPAMGFEEVD